MTRIPFARAMLLLGGLAGVFHLDPPAAEADSLCAPRDQIVSVLVHQLKETPEAIGKTLDGLVVEVFVSQTHSWTILLTTTKGISCIAATGDNWTRATRLPEAGI